jgi:transcriptional regulator GlxA family with amidase domain
MRTMRLFRRELVANDVSKRDVRIERALAAIAKAPAERWTVARLAKLAGLSRAAFARRFRLEVGVSPLRFVADLRLQKAANLLVASDESIAAIAGMVGYANEFALSRAFRRFTGTPPGVYRRTSRVAETRFTPRCLAA